jgi:DNA invertase Pin-like site-specific DNA recombinase
MEKMVLYARVSTQDKQDPQSQIDDLRRHFEHYFEIDETFGEHVSGYDSEDLIREEYERMKTYVIQSNIKHIGIWEISRLGRTMLTTLKEIQEFRDEGVNIHFKKEGLNSISDNRTNQAFLALLSSWAEQEGKDFVERTTRGRMKKALEGKAIGYAVLPYGYQKGANGKLEENKEEAEAVRLMYKLADEGKTLRWIAKNLDDKYPTRHELMGKTRDDGSNFKWKANVVRRILVSPKYKGIREYKGHEIPMVNLVDKDLWERVNEKMQANVTAMNRTKYSYLFKSKMICGHCGRYYCSQTNHKTMVSFYFCNGGRNRYTRCDNGFINTQVIDDNLYKILFFHKDSLLTLYNNERKVKEIEDRQRQLELHTKEIERLNKRKSTLVNLRLNDDITQDRYDDENKSIKNALVEHKNQIGSIERQLKSLNDISLTEAISKLYQNGDFNTKRDFILKYVDDIRIYRAQWNNIQVKKKKNPFYPTFDKKPRLDDKVLYIELFAFKNKTPLQIVLTSRTHNVIVSKRLFYFKEIEYLRVEGDV